MRLTLQEWNDNVIDPLNALYESDFWYQTNGWIIGYRANGDVDKLIPEFKEPGERITMQDVARVQKIIFGHQGMLSGEDSSPDEDRWIRPTRITLGLYEQILDRIDKKLMLSRQVLSQSPEVIVFDPPNGENGWIYGDDVIDYWSAFGMPSGYSGWAASMIVDLLQHDGGSTSRNGSATGSTITGTTLNDVSSGDNIRFIWNGASPSGSGAEAIAMYNLTVLFSNTAFPNPELATAVSNANSFSGSAGALLEEPVTYTFEPELAGAGAPGSGTYFPALAEIPYRDP